MDGQLEGWTNQPTDQLTDRQSGSMSRVQATKHDGLCFIKSPIAFCAAVFNVIAYEDF